jgi:hypothetical protein
MGMNIQKIKIDKIKPNKENPRMISKDKKKKLIQSIKDFPQMLEIRPIVVDDTMTILGGNMRYDACKEAGLKEVYIIKTSDLTEEQKKEFIIKDNVGFGEWDWDTLANNWEIDELEEWGMDVGYLSNSAADDFYSKKIDAPEYEPMNTKPNIDILYDDSKKKSLLEKINNANISNQDKEFLRIASNRHIIFDYARIADYYANSDKEVQTLMEENALVIIDFQKAIKNGYVKITEQIAESFDEE